jgi:hypothetical protein
MKETIDKLLLFTGAGFSQEAGCLPSAAMLKQLSEMICQPENSIFTKPEKNTLTFLLSCLEYHSRWRSLETSNTHQFSPNIEELALLIRRIKNRENILPYPITGNWSDKLLKFEEDYRELNPSGTSKLDLYQSMDNSLKSSCLRKWLKIEDSSFDYSYLNVLKDFFSNYPSEDFKLHVFTLNNDLVLERFLQKEQPPFTGFTNGRWVGFTQPHLGTEHNPSRIFLYKLHGSMDWIRANDERIYLRDEAEKLHDSSPEFLIEQDPYIIFGHGTKFFSIDPFYSLVKEFQETLDRKKYIIIIGYSFFDPYINNLLFNAVNKFPERKKKLIIVGPDLAKSFTEDSYFESKFGFDKVLKAAYNKNILSFFKDVQNNSFYSDLPEFNIRTISNDSLLYINTKTGDLLNKLFGNKGNGLLDLISHLDSEEENIF